jgi:Arc/MetJ-type ribon-helix-helix transcriptional regulator
MSLGVLALETLGMLAEKWNTSKSEVIRRSVRKAKEADAMNTARMSPVEALKWIRAGGGLNEEQAKPFLNEVAAERAAKKTSGHSSCLTAT